VQRVLLAAPRPPSGGHASGREGHWRGIGDLAVASGLHFKLVENRSVNGANCCRKLKIWIDIS